MEEERKDERGKGEKERGDTNTESMRISKLGTSCIYILEKLFEIYRILQINEVNQCYCKK